MYVEPRKIDVLNLAMAVAKNVSDGHFTLMRFTTNWRCGFYTAETKEEINNLSEGRTKEEAVTNAIIHLLERN